MQNLFESADHHAQPPARDTGVITLALPTVPAPAPAPAPVAVASPPASAPPPQSTQPPVYLLAHQLQPAAAPATVAAGPHAWYGAAVHVAAPVTEPVAAQLHEALHEPALHEPLSWRLAKDACILAFACTAVLVALNAGNDPTMALGYAACALLTIVTFVTADRARFLNR